MNHEHQSENVSLAQLAKKRSADRVSGDHRLLPFHRTPRTFVRHSSLLVASGLPVHAHVYASRSRQGRERSRKTSLRR
jgi:hypothetical protein